jgi:hypothetical protein
MTKKEFLIAFAIVVGVIILISAAVHFLPFFTVLTDIVSFIVGVVTGATGFWIYKNHWK